MSQRSRLFVNKGGDALSEIKKINERLKTLRSEMETDFPLDADGEQTLRDQIAQQVQTIHDIEQPVIAEMRSAMS